MQGATLEVKSPKLDEHGLRTATALLMFAGPSLSRSQLRKLLPDGDCELIGQKRINVTSRGFRWAIKTLERIGYIKRDGESTINIIDHSGLLELVQANLTSAENAAYVDDTLERSAAGYPHDHLDGDHPSHWSGLKRLVQVHLALAEPHSSAEASP